MHARRTVGRVMLSRRAGGSVSMVDRVTDRITSATDWHPAPCPGPQKPL